MRRKFDEPLRKKLSRLEANGKLYVALAEGSEVPYLSMPLKRPQDIETSWDELLAWQDFWRKAPKASDGHPLWHVEEKRKQTVSFGKQLMPRSTPWRSSDSRRRKKNFWPAFQL